ncbi:MAG: GGDEF domain-containing protein [Pirellulaceae bacterium]
MQITANDPYTVKQFSTSNCLPTLPEVASKLIELAQQEDPDFREVARVIRTDPVVSGKVMKTVNSALFGFRPKVETIEDAVNKLGLNMIRTLLLSFHLAQHDSDQAELEPIWQDHWRSSLTQAVFAELIAEQLGVEPSAYFLAAMIQDIGILAIVSEKPRLYVDSILDRGKFPTVAAAERSVLGFCHVDVSAEIIRNWGLAARFEQAVLHHHDQVVPAPDKDDDPIVAVTRAASLGAAVVLSSSNSDALDDMLDQWTDCLKTQFDITPEQANEMISEVNALVNEYSVLFRFNIGESVRADRVVAKAKDMLQEIALANQMALVASKSTSRKNRIENHDLYRDELSGLHNRRFMNEHLSDLMASAINKKKPIALLFMDVDQFKRINDNLGHSIGDQAIQHVANWLQSSIRSEDFAIRLGGDEFLVILESITMPQFRVVAQRVASEIPPMQLDSDSIEIRLSAGGTFYQPATGDRSDPNWLIDQADRSMYVAKRSGGGCVAIEQYNGMGQR